MITFLFYLNEFASEYDLGRNLLVDILKIDRYCNTFLPVSPKVLILSFLGKSKFPIKASKQIPIENFLWKELNRVQAGNLDSSKEAPYIFAIFQALNNVPLADPASHATDLLTFINFLSQYNDLPSK